MRAPRLCHGRRHPAYPLSYLPPLLSQAGQRPVKMWNVESSLGGWGAAQHKFFDAGQVLDRIQSEVGARRVERGKAGARVERHN